MVLNELKCYDKHGRNGTDQLSIVFNTERYNQSFVTCTKECMQLSDPKYLWQQYMLKSMKGRGLF